MERKEKTERPPALYDLTTLQRDANRILGIPPSRRWITSRPSMRRKLASSAQERPSVLDGLKRPAQPGPDRGTPPKHSGPEL